MELETERLLFNPFKESESCFSEEKSVNSVD